MQHLCLYFGSCLGTCHLLTGMTLLPSMPSSSARQDFTKSEFPLEAWYDPCKPVMQCKNIADETERLLMTFSGEDKQDMTAMIVVPPTIL